MATDTVPLKQYPEWVRGTAYIDGYEIVLDAIFRLLGIVEVAQNAKSLREYLRWQAGRGAISTSIPEDDQKMRRVRYQFLGSRYHQRTGAVCGLELVPVRWTLVSNTKYVCIMVHYAEDYKARAAP
jgi:hypothetical protein